jgi:UDP-N-acetylglucosamine 1-carboxyvinyltransferase
VGERFLVTGGNRLAGEVAVGGAKNSVLKLMAASLLAEGTTTITNCPDILDVPLMAEVLRGLGANVELDGSVVRITSPDEPKYEADFAAVRQFRASVCVLGPLVGRCKRARVALPGGDAIGSRPLDMHQSGLRQLGAECTIEHGCVVASADRLRGAEIQLEFPSVGATENILMAAVVAEGVTTIHNAAREPDVVDLCEMLNQMGAQIEGLGTSMLKITGVDKLHGAEITINSDYHEIVTFLALGAITGGEVRVTKALPHHFDLISRAFKKLGVIIEHEGDTVVVRRGQKLVIETPFTTNLLPKIEAAPWPYFSVDLLPLMIALSTRCDGTIHFWNKVYENGFSWIPELAKFGAHALVSDPHRLVVFGNRPLRPATVESPYIIRAAVALYMVAAAIPGQSVVRHAEIIKRAHPRFVENLRTLGAEVEWK